jgi:hypothetical protein
VEADRRRPAQLEVAVQRQHETAPTEIHAPGAFDAAREIVAQIEESPLQREAERARG